MMPRVLYIERHPSEAVSIERVFREVAPQVEQQGFEIAFQQVPYANGVRAIANNLLRFRHRPADLYHVTGDVHYITLLLPGDRTVLTVHDLVFLHRRTGLRRWVLKKLFRDLPLRRVARVTTVSQAIRDEIVDHLPDVADKIIVIDNPLIGDAYPDGSASFNAERPVILHIGTAENKNLSRLVRALRGLSCVLRIVGRIDAGTRAELAANAVTFENVYSLDAGQMNDEYRRADIVAYCSTYEGFGLPIIEAQRMRTPVVTSRLAPMSTVAGGGAMLVDPYDTASIRQGIESVIEDAGLRQRLVAAGEENITRFHPARVAERYADLYREVLGNL